MSPKPLIIGTRGSNLALVQAHTVQAALRAAMSERSVELRVIKTKGDKIQDVALSKIGGKGIFTKELEVALIDGRIDLAVHSLKDLPTEFPPGLKLGGVLPRHHVEDALVARVDTTLEQLPAGSKVATSSLRRKAQVLHLRPDVEVIDIRGNVETRLQKLDSGYCDATIMAAAGLSRAGQGDRITQLLDPLYFIPAVSQGIIAMETREDDHELDTILNQITDQPAWRSAIAERAFLRTMEGGCLVPVGCYTEWGEEFRITGFVASVDGNEFIIDSKSGHPDNAPDIAKLLANELLEAGGGAILAKIRSDEPEE